LRLSSLFAIALILGACGKSTPQEEDPGSGSLADGGSGVFGGTKDGGPTSNIPECAEETKDVFVISAEKSLYSFHPPTLAFKNLGLINCPTGGATPTSMAVDRYGKAWVRHSDGSIWKVDTKTLKCDDSKFAPPGGTDGAFFQFGMGFASTSKGSSNEELFLSDSQGSGLAQLDTRNLSLKIVGPFTGEHEGKAAELTGTGDGKLYGFFVTAPARIAEISKGTGAIVSSKELTNTYAGTAWAFSFYGGDFYIYTASDGGGGLPSGGLGSDVTRYRPSDGSIEIVKTKIGFKIVGAGVSTCAPTTGPR